MKNEIGNIEYNVAIAEKLLQSDEEPDIDLNESCRKPYPCAFWSYCTMHIPQLSVFDIYRLWFSKKIDFYRKGWITYNDLLLHAPIKNEAMNGLKNRRGTIAMARTMVVDSATSQFFRLEAK